MIADTLGNRMKVIPALMILAVVFALTAIPAFAIDVFEADPVEAYQGSEKPRVFKADPVEKFEAETPEVFIADPLKPEKKGPDGPRSVRKQWGLIEFISPENWESGTENGSLGFVPRDVPKGLLCILLISPASTLSGDFADWFDKSTRGKFSASLDITGSSAVKEIITTDNDKLLLCTLITQNKSGERMSLSFVGIKRQSRVQLISFIASSSDLMLKYLPDYQIFMQSLKIVSEGANVGKDNKPEPQINKKEPVSPIKGWQPVASGNAVEPLSNGLLLNMDSTAITNKFGEPLQDDRFVGGGIGYPQFGVIFNATGEQIWHFTMLKDIKLNCGIGIGSKRQDINAVFGAGKSVYGDTLINYDQYKLYFSFNGDVITQIKIDPAQGTFKPYKKISFNGLKSKKAPVPAR
ncbi:MAG: hypothetical protein ACYC27_03370 [Armatimonadota bacterium]